MTDTVERPKKKRVTMRPIIIVMLGFLVIIAIGALFLSMPIANTDGKWLSFPHALFTATSAVCVTGLVVRPTAVAFSGFGQAMLLILIQAGGLGFMTLATLIFILIRKRITLKDRIAIQESLGQDHIKGVVRLVRNIAIMTLIIEATGALMLLPFFVVKNGGIGVWQAVFTSVSAFCNAGFDILGTAQAPYASLTPYSGNAGILLIVGLLITLGGLGFTVINDIIKCKFKWRRLLLQTKVVLIASLVLLLFGMFFFLGSEWKSDATLGMNGGQKLLNALFQSITARTAGFNSIDQTGMSSGGKILTCFLMFVGASPGGTGGGIKTTTFFVLILMGYSGLRGKDDIVLCKHSISLKSGMRAVAAVLIAVVLIFIGGLIVSMTDNVSVGDAFFEVISAFGTVGLSLGATSSLPIGALFVLMFLMFAGRLGALSMGMLFTKKEHSSLKYPPANLMIG